jgi:Kelch motif/Galactose oxidase, central domain
MASAVYYPTTNDTYVFGGFNFNNGTAINLTRIYDIATDTWSAGPNMPGGRQQMASGYNPANGKIYLAGGYTDGFVNTAQTTLWEFDPVAGSFTVKAPMPNALGGPAFGVINNHFIVAGGRDVNEIVLGATYSYDVATDTWATRAPMPSPTNVPGQWRRGRQALLVRSGQTRSFPNGRVSRPIAGSLRHAQAARTRLRRRLSTTRWQTPGQAARI